MSSFALLLIAVQACLLQTVFGQIIGGYGCGTEFAPRALAGACGYGADVAATGRPFGLGLASPYGYGAEIGPFGLGRAGPAIAGPAYGGTGVGEVDVQGELPVAGSTLVAGQVPIIGAVEFGGAVPAAGSVSIAGSCACGCGGYFY